MEFQKYIPVSLPELFIGILAFICFASIIAGSRISRLTDSSAITSEKPVDLYLSGKIDLEQLSSILADSGVIESRRELMWAGKLLGWRSFTRGHYQIDGDYSYDVLLSRMARGIQDPISLTILPGRYEGELISNIASNFPFDSTELTKAMSDSAFLAELQLDEQDLVGRMLPNTYSVYWTLSPESVVKRVLNEFKAAVVEAHQERIKELDKSIDEIITLASIIEWEARHDDEKPKISGLYWNRLERGMPLQADPTVNFAVGERRRLLYADYQIDHQYNTYRYKGLPPGPITNPSLSSIEAALYPTDHDYYYMVANPEGYHVFSETFEEHKEESAKWREWIRKQYRIKRQKEQEAAEKNSK